MSYYFVAIDHREYQYDDVVYQLGKVIYLGKRESLFFRSTTAKALQQHLIKKRDTFGQNLFIIKMFQTTKINMTRIKHDVLRPFQQVFHAVTHQTN